MAADTNLHQSKAFAGSVSTYREGMSAFVEYVDSVCSHVVVTLMQAIVVGACFILGSIWLVLARTRRGVINSLKEAAASPEAVSPNALEKAERVERGERGERGERAEGVDRVVEGVPESPGTLESKEGVSLDGTGTLPPNAEPFPAASSSDDDLTIIEGSEAEAERERERELALYTQQGVPTSQAEIDEVTRWPPVCVM
ncbi:hypothetical protein KIPB_001803 [Kipferlia bialata]|uniref:Transmembrane protein n=1 Tax=Kipferlia bialata TaxID=797122 RepID=A0A9K3GFD7_9EUKA|nr:hypothetical protein KIPB_001803 [Kipferlia bialata]|eukprot:g1803.t1